MSKNKLPIIGVIVVIGVVGYYLFSPNPHISQISKRSCLTLDEIAFHDTNAGHDDIVIKNKNSNIEIYRFVLPSSTLFVNTLDQCNIYVTVASHYMATPDSNHHYDILHGGSLDRWQYSYDGSGKNIKTIVDNTGGKVWGVPADDKITISIDSTGRYVSAVKSVEGFITIQIMDLNSGAILFSTNSNELANKYHIAPAGSMFVLWKLNNSSAYWSQWNNEEAFLISIQAARGGGLGAIIRTNGWTVSTP